ncbi:MAG: hypothetical protein WKG01_42440, partial [Kofleriaceae bacterium]
MLASEFPVARPGAMRWALGWVDAARLTIRYPRRAAARTGDVSVRRAALPLLADDELASWSRDPSLADAIAVELHGRHTHEAHAAVLALAGCSARTRALQLDVLARRGEWALVEPGLRDPHHGPRAIAARWLVRAGRIDPAIVAA